MMGGEIQGKRRTRQVNSPSDGVNSCSIGISGQHCSNTRSLHHPLAGSEGENDHLTSNGSISACGVQPRLQPIMSFSPGVGGDVFSLGVLTSPNRGNIISNSSIIEILVHLLCREREQDHARQELLFKALCDGIKTWNNSLYLPLHAFPELQEFRTGLLRKFEFLFEEIQDKITSNHANVIMPSVLSPPSGSPLTQLFLTNFHQICFVDDRYSREFAEVCVLGRGGFGVVVKARNKLDGCLYAVKIIRMLEPKSESNCKLLREVQALAQLSHPNIVRYHSAWLQMSTALPNLQPKTREMKGYQKQRFIRKKIPIYLQPASHVRIQELSSSSNPVGIDFEESSGGVVFADVSESPLSSNQPQKCDRISERGESSYDSLAKSVRSQSSSSNCPKNYMERKHGCSRIGKREISSKAKAFSDEKLNDQKGLWKVRRSSYLDTTSFRSSDSYPECSLMVSDSAKMTLFIQMGLCSGTLADWISKRNNLFGADNKPYSVNETVCLDIFKQILMAVEYIHSKNIIHRDLKPQNIFFTEDRHHIQLGDFGLARSLPDVGNSHAENDSTQRFCLIPISNSAQNTGGVGTPIYAGPELTNSSFYGSESDMHNLGIILLELFYPFHTGAERVHVITDLKTKQYLEPDFIVQHHHIANLIRKLTHPDPSERPTASKILKMELFTEGLPNSHENEKILVSGRNPLLKEKELALGRRGVIEVTKNVSSVKKTLKLNIGKNCKHRYRQDTEVEDQINSVFTDSPDKVSYDSSPLSVEDKFSHTEMITILERENKKKDEEILKLREENSELKERLARFEKQISQNDEH